jgi:hypothetical protein
MRSTSRKKTGTLAARDTYHVLGPQGELAVKGAAPHALVTAQGRAQRMDGEVTLTVERRSLFGPSATLYRVVRTEDGTVYTSTINAED